MKHMKMMWTAEIEIFKWRYDRCMYESRNRTQNIEPHVCDCLLLLPFSLRECSKFWVSSEAGRAEGNIGVISFLNPLTGDGISGENQPAVFVAISCRLRPAQENECSRDYLFFFLHSWLVEKLQREFWSNHKASICSWYEARENACSRDYPLLFFTPDWLRS